MFRNLSREAATKISIIYNDKTSTESVLPGHGFSALVGDDLLFDTGTDPDIFSSNIKEMGIDMDRVDKVFISHSHYDHTGNLEMVLKGRRGMTVYGCPGFGEDIKELVEESGNIYEAHDGYAGIAPGLFTTGEIAGDYKGRYMPEQALVISGERGLCLLTGCAHPGITKIVEHARGSAGDAIKTVIGGFHLLNENEESIQSVISDMKASGVCIAAPLHCTGEKATRAFQDSFKDGFIDLKAGQHIDI